MFQELAPCPRMAVLGLQAPRVQETPLHTPSSQRSRETAEGRVASHEGGHVAPGRMRPWHALTWSHGVAPTSRRAGHMAGLVGSEP